MDYDPVAGGNNQIESWLKPQKLELLAEGEGWRWVYSPLADQCVDLKMRHFVDPEDVAGSWGEQVSRWVSGIPPMRCHDGHPETWMGTAYAIRCSTPPITIATVENIDGEWTLIYTDICWLARDVMRRDAENRVRRCLVLLGRSTQAGVIHAIDGCLVVAVRQLLEESRFRPVSRISLDPELRDGIATRLLSSSQGEQGRWLAHLLVGTPKAELWREPQSFELIGQGGDWTSVYSPLADQYVDTKREDESPEREVSRWSEKLEQMSRAAPRVRKPQRFRDVPHRVFAVVEWGAGRWRLRYLDLDWLSHRLDALGDHRLYTECRRVLEHASCGETKRLVIGHLIQRCQGTGVESTEGLAIHLLASSDPGARELGLKLIPLCRKGEGGPPSGPPREKWNGPSCASR